MKHSHGTRLCSLLLTLALCLALPGTALADDGGNANFNYDVNAARYMDATTAPTPENTRRAFLQALRDANQISGERNGQMVTVYVPAGTYELDGPMIIYSNTHLILDDQAVIVRSSGEGQEHTLLSPPDGEEECPGYSRAENIVVEGGTWDGNATSASTTMTSIMVFRHCQNITFKNFTVRRGTGHFINASSTKNLTVEGVTFSDSVAIPYAAFKDNYDGNAADGQSRFETLHLDTEGTDNDPYDSTVPQNVTVTGCTFRKVFSGVGTHRSPVKYKGTLLYGKNINISNNLFEDVQGHCINAYQYRGLTVDGNRCHRVGSLIWMRDTSGVIKNHTDVTFVRDGETNVRLLQADSCTAAAGLKVTGNVFSGDSDRALRIENCAGVEVSGNRFTGSCKEYTLNLSGCNGAAVKNNTINTTANRMVHIDNCAKLNISGNSVTGRTVPYTGNSGASEERLFNLDKCSNATVSKNTVKGNTTRLFQVSNSPNATVSNNTVTGTASDRIMNFGGETVRNTKMQVLNNRISGTSAMHLCMLKSPSATVKGNTLTGTASDRLLSVGESASATVSGNVLNGKAGTLLFLRQGNKAQVTSNKLTGGTERSIQLSETNGATLKGNTLSKVGKEGIYLTSNSPNNRVESNTITGTSASATGKGIGLATGANNSVATKNVIKNTGVGIYVSQNSGSRLTYNQISGSGTASVQVTSKAKKASLSWNKLDARGIRAPKGVCTVLTPKKPKLAAAKKALTVSWTKVSGAGGYQLQYSAASGFKNAKSVSPSGVKKKLTGLAAKKKYVVRVRGWKKVGKVTFYTPWSPTVSAKTK